MTEIYTIDGGKKDVLLRRANIKNKTGLHPVYIFSFFFIFLIDKR